MRKTLLAAFIVALTGGAALTLQAQAQMPPADHPAAPDERGGMHGQKGAFGGHFAERWHARMRMMTLIYPADDRKLGGADVQKIAEAFLLWNGNHSWKVTEVTEEPERVTFAYAGMDGTVIARFALDRATGRATRLG